MAKAGGDSHICTMGPDPSSHKSRNDTYTSLRYPEFKHHLITRFAVIFALTIQFVIIEWYVYVFTQDSWSLGLIGLSEVIPRFPWRCLPAKFLAEGKNPA